MFTGDPSGDWLFRALHRAGFANQPTSTARDDGLVLRDCYVTAAVRCAPPQNRPTRAEFDRCQPFLERELRLLPRLRVVVALGQLAFDAFVRTWRQIGHAVPVPKPRFRHGLSEDLPPVVLLASYHPSQRNTATGLLTEAMFDTVFRKARATLATVPDAAKDSGDGDR
jgi:uracil-DNA glycosylase family 4